MSGEVGFLQYIPEWIILKSPQWWLIFTSIVMAVVAVAGFLANLSYIFDKFNSLYQRLSRWFKHDSLDHRIKIEDPHGNVPLNSPFYRPRPPIETKCYRLIDHANAVLRIKAPRQMGKTS